MTAVGITPTTKVGLLAARPATTTNGAQYYATDARPNFRTANGRGVMYVGVGASWQSVSRAEEETLGWFNVLDHGLVPDAQTGWTDNTSAFNTLLGLADSALAMTIHFPWGRYYGTFDASTVNGISIVGEGPAGQSPTLGQGVTQLVGKDGATTLTVGSTTQKWRGVRVADLSIYERNTGMGVGGVLLQQASDSLIQNVTCGQYTTGYGLKLDGGSAAALNYVTVINYRAGPCLYGLWNHNAIGTRLISAQLDGANDVIHSANVIAGSSGLYLESGDSFRSWGTHIIGYDTLIEAHSQEIICDAMRFEGWRTQVLHCSSNVKASRFWGTGDNSLIGSLGVAYSIDSGAQDVDLTYLNLVNTGTGRDSGTRTILPGGKAWFPAEVTTVLRVAGTVPASGADAADYASIVTSNQTLDRVKATCKTPPSGAMSLQLRKATNAGTPSWADVTGGAFAFTAGAAAVEASIGSGVVATPSIVKSLGTNVTSASGLTVALTTTGTVAAGNRILLRVGWKETGVTISTVSGMGAVWTIDKQANASLNNVAIISSDAFAGGLATGNTVTVTFGSAVADKTIAATEMQGVGVVDQTASKTSVSPTLDMQTNATSATAQNVELVVASFRSGNTQTTFVEHGGYTALADQALQSGQGTMSSTYKVTSGTGTQQETATGGVATANWAAVIVTYLPAGAAVQVSENDLLGMSIVGSGGGTNLEVSVIGVRR